ncbi:MAG TPA: carboxypeptidase-like regulatory domain-containing protein [Gemmata sp.]
MTRFVFGSLALFGVLILAGCGGGAGDAAVVTGTVSLRDGKPLPGGRIDFHSKSGLLTGQIKADGTYEMTAVPPGEYKVSVENGHLKNAGPPPAGLAPMPTDNAGTKYVPYDPKYNKPESSGLTTTVKGPTHTFDVQLK